MQFVTCKMLQPPIRRNEIIYTEGSTIQIDTTNNPYNTIHRLLLQYYAFGGFEA